MQNPMSAEALPSAAGRERPSSRGLIVGLAMLCLVAVLPWSVFITPLFVVFGVLLARRTRGSIVPAVLVGLAYVASRMTGLLLPEWIWDANALSPLRDPALLLARTCAEALFLGLPIVILGDLVRRRDVASPAPG